MMEKAFVRGYFDDAKEVARLGDKLWHASTKAIPEQVAQAIFPLECRNLNSDSVELKDRCGEKRLSLVTFAFNAFGEPHCKSFSEPFLKAFAAGGDDVQLIQVQVEETWTKVPILKMMVSFIRKRIPLHQHVCLSPHF